MTEQAGGGGEAALHGDRRHADSLLLTPLHASASLETIESLEQTAPRRDPGRLHVTRSHAVLHAGYTWPPKVCSGAMRSRLRDQTALGSKLPLHRLCEDHRGRAYAAGKMSASRPHEGEAAIRDGESRRGAPSGPPIANLPWDGHERSPAAPQNRRHPPRARARAAISRHSRSEIIEMTFPKRARCLLRGSDGDDCDMTYGVRDRYTEYTMARGRRAYMGEPSPAAATANAAKEASQDQDHVKEMRLFTPGGQRPAPCSSWRSGWAYRARRVLRSRRSQGLANPMRHRACFTPPKSARRRAKCTRRWSTTTRCATA